MTAPFEHSRLGAKRFVKQSWIQCQPGVLQDHATFYREDMIAKPSPSRSGWPKAG